MATAARVRKPAAERERDLLAAALEGFAEGGFDGVSVQDIARRAGVAAGTVYLYFPSKEHLLLGLHAQFHDGLAEVFVGLADDVRDRVEAGVAIDVGAVSDQVVDALVAYSVEHRAHCAVLTTSLPRLAGSDDAEVPQGAFGELLGAVLEEVTERGLVDLTHPRVAAHLLSTATIQTIGPAVADGEPEHLARLIEQTKEIFRRVLTWPVGRSEGDLDR